MKGTLVAVLDISKLLKLTSALPRLMRVSSGPNILAVDNRRSISLPWLKLPQPMPPHRKVIYRLLAPPLFRVMVLLNPLLNTRSCWVWYRYEQTSVINRALTACFPGLPVGTCIGLLWPTSGNRLFSTKRSIRIRR
ncbi:hypothetical protein [Marine gokushovirus]|nr:hypothetical protein [Marine gokushovirus]